MLKTRLRQSSNAFNAEVLQAIRISLIACILFLSGCSVGMSPANQSVDRSFITGIPCAAPCWYGLVPGVSAEADVKAMLPTLPFVEPSTIREFELFRVDDKPVKDVRFDCSYTQDLVESCGRLTIYEGRLTNVSTYVEYALTFREVADRIGTPELVSYAPAGPEDVTCVISLDWPKQGISTTAFHTGEPCPSEIDQGSVQLVNSETRVTILSYSANDLEDTDAKSCDTCRPFPGFSN